MVFVLESGGPKTTDDPQQELRARVNNGSAWLLDPGGLLFFYIFLISWKEKCIGQLLLNTDLELIIHNPICANLARLPSLYNTCCVCAKRISGLLPVPTPMDPRGRTKEAGGMSTYDMMHGFRVRLSIIHATIYTKSYAIRLDYV